MANVRKTATAVLGLLLLGTVLAARPGDTVESIAKRIRETDIAVPSPRPFHIDLAREVVSTTRTLHYSRRRIDRATSQEWFDEFFDVLDGNRNFFLASDIAEFESFRNVLGMQVYRQGRIQFAYDVYGRLLKRIRQWSEYAMAHIDDDFDFTVDETITLDRRKEPRAKDMAELEGIWRRQLKNSFLQIAIERDRRQERLARKKAEAQKDAPENGKEEPDEQQEEQPEEQTDPKVIVLRRYERYLARRADVEAVEILELFLTSLTRIYDPHSAYMAPATNEDFNIDMRQSLTGIGARLTTEDGYVTIVDILPGGPAEKDGRLKPGDRIVAVAEKGSTPIDIIDKPLPKVVQRIRGEKGTTILLTVLEKDSNHKTIIDLVRDVVKLEDGSATRDGREIDLPTTPDAPAGAKISVIYLPAFYRDFQSASLGRSFKSAGQDLRRLLAEAAESEELDGLILDLRGNGGGALEEAIDIAGLFFGEGPVVQVKRVVGRPRVRFDRDITTVYSGPLVVLVDKSSASASEIVAAALQDYHRAVIVGDASTHGKGTVQQKIGLDDRFKENPEYADERAGALKLTLAKYYRVTGGSTQLRGVVPDITFPSYTDHMEMGEAKIPHAMPWDEIKPAAFSCDVDVTPYLPELLSRSTARRADNGDFKRMVGDIENYGERRKQKTLPLSMKERRKLIDEEEEWSKKLREARLAGKNRRKTKNKLTKKEDKEPAKDKTPGKDGEDLVLDEALAILGDLISLQADPEFKTVAAKKVEPALNELENELD